jgi:hypothetical protein
VADPQPTPGAAEIAHPVAAALAVLGVLFGIVVGFTLLAFLLVIVLPRVVILL